MMPHPYGPMMGMHPHHPYAHAHHPPMQIHHHIPGGKDAPAVPHPVMSHVPPPGYPYHATFHHPFGFPGHPMGMPGHHVYHTTPPTSDKKSGSSSGSKK